MAFGDRIKRTITDASLDDAPDATQLIILGLPTACPTCGSHTRLADVPTGWLCTNPSCTFSS